MEGERTLMRIHVNEVDRAGGKRLYEAIVQLLRESFPFPVLELDELVEQTGAIAEEAADRVHA